MNESQAKATLFPEGQNLLNGLYVVQDYMLKESEKLNEFWELERQYRDYQQTKLREQIDIDKPKEKSEYALFIAGIAFCLTFGLVGLLSGNISELIFCLIITAVFAIGKIKGNKKLLKIGKILLVLLLLSWLQGFANVLTMSKGNIAGIIFYLLINIAALASAIVVAKIALNKYNKKIEEDNEREKEAVRIQNKKIEQNNKIVDQKRHALSSEITALSNELQRETSQWYPVDYYSLDSVAKFITIVKNHEADTIKEMLSIYKQDAYRTQVLSNQNTMISQLNQSLYNQNEMISLQREANMIQMATCVASFITAGNTNAIKANTASTAESAKRVADKVAPEPTVW